MVLFAFLIFLYVALSSLGSGTDEAAAVPTKKVDISQFSAGDAEFLIWEGRPVVVYRRFDHEISALEQPNFFLADPESRIKHGLLRSLWALISVVALSCCPQVQSCIKGSHGVADLSTPAADPDSILPAACIGLNIPVETW